MIAAISEAQKVVWGIGRTDTEAISDAHKEAKNKPDIKMGALLCVPLKDNAPLEYDGVGLFEYCVFTAETENESVQFDLL